jgi:hypothetical protein
MVAGAAGHDLFLGKDAEVKAAQDNSTNFTVLSSAEDAPLSIRK